MKTAGRFNSRKFIKDCQGLHESPCISLRGLETRTVRLPVEVLYLSRSQVWILPHFYRKGYLSFPGFPQQVLKPVFQFYSAQLSEALNMIAKSSRK